MNHLFTYKARIILFALLVCHFGLKAQSVSDTVKSTTLAMNADTSLTKKAGSQQLIKADTTLVIKAGATLVHKADTTMVIDPDGSLAKKFNEIVAAKESAELAKNNASVKVDSALLKPDAKPVTPPVADPASSAATTGAGAASTVTSAPNTDANLPKSTDKTQQQLANTTPTDQPAKKDSTQQIATTDQAVKKDDATQQASAPSPAVKKDSTVQQVATTDQSAKKDDATQPANTGSDQSVKKADSSLVAKIDTTIAKKTDTIPGKKVDTTLKKSDTTLMVKDTSANHVIKAENGFLEVGGAGLAISANYDTRFHQERNGWGYRVGLGFFSSGGNTVFTVPFQINYLIGEHATMFELGAGTTFLNSTGTNIGNSKWEFDKITGFIATATIGFRYQPEHKGINLRIGFVPILYDEGIIPAGGVSIGYTFK